ncbi:nucleoside-triphosphatase [Peptoniphilus indolicus]|uniref:Putative NTPase n=1 Tax=Peptoniphilus indolicus TaxID=33030 RepID=A0A379DE63_9FIRM|nr:nucleoside-triphosphatase [Peptoniphilus indolicus]SUB76278.1 putative NTPase [Peptoniphilus indolicus]
MKTNLMISLKSGVGKSTSLLQYLFENREKYNSISGYTTRRVYRNNKVYGYILIEINKALDLYSCNHSSDSILKCDYNEIVIDEVFLTTLDSKYVFNQDIFEKYFFEYIDLNSDLIVIDEIGGKELLNPKIFDTLLEIFNSNKNSIVVYKLQEQFNNMLKSSNKLADEILSKRKILEENLSSFNSITPINVNKPYLTFEILEKYLNHGETNE